jgi:hypothetical protein
MMMMRRTTTKIRFAENCIAGTTAKAKGKTKRHKNRDGGGTRKGKGKGNRKGNREMVSMMKEKRVLMATAAKGSCTRL